MATNAQAAALGVEREERELEGVLSRLRHQNMRLTDYVCQAEAFLDRTMPPTPKPVEPSRDNAKVGHAVVDTHMSSLRVTMSETDELLHRLDTCASTLNRLG